MQPLRPGAPGRSPLRAPATGTRERGASFKKPAGDAKQAWSNAGNQNMTAVILVR
jgi:hypothetical protein